jgi:hypothetical protein
MTDEPENLILRRLDPMRDDMRAMRGKLDEMQHTQREHGAGFSRLEQGQGLMLQMLQRVHEPLDRAEVRLELREP